MAWLMNHYKMPYTKSHVELNKYRKQFEGETIPRSPRPPSERGAGIVEWEGPFFCRVIDQLMKPSFMERLKGIHKAWRNSCEAGEKS